MNESDLYQYSECGLDYICLSSGFTRHATAYGEGVSVVDAEGLHRAIGEILAQSSELAGQDIRFLRKELDWSQAMLARVLERSEDAVSKWERDQNNMPKAERVLLQTLWTEHFGGNSKVSQLVDKLSNIDRQIDELNYGYDAENGWQSNTDDTKKCA